MRRLADTRRLEARAWQAASEAARALLTRWADDGWLHPIERHI
jgi:50S ribosomal protein L16 3-hydroxylase